MTTKGFTLIESLVVLAIFAVLILVTIMYLKPKVQISKAQDGQRKSDLEKISKALENYLNDNLCYPEASFFSQCNTQALSPYLRTIPCDPQTKEPYLYERPECLKFAIYTSLVTENQNISYDNKGNYVISSANYRIVPQIAEEPTGSVPTFSLPEPTEPVPTSAVIPYGCFAGVCQRLGQYQQCEPNYYSSDCYGACSNPINECTVR